MRNLTIALVTVALGWGAAASAQPYRADPADGPRLPMQGLYTSGFEVSAMRPCQWNSSDCGSGGDARSTSECWVEFSPLAFGQVRGYSGGMVLTRTHPTRHLIAFMGRETRGEGSYGHLGAYPCRIVVEQVTGYKAL